MHARVAHTAALKTISRIKLYAKSVVVLNTILSVQLARHLELFSNAWDTHTKSALPLHSRGEMRDDSSQSIVPRPVRKKETKNEHSESTH